MTTVDAPACLAPTPEALRDLLRGGPSAEAAGRLLPGARLVGLGVERVHFPGGRPVQLLIRAATASGGDSMIIGEWAGEHAAEVAAAEAARLAKPRRGQAAAAGEAVVADRASGLVLRRPGFDTRLPGLRLLHDADWAAANLPGLGCDPASNIRLVAHRLGKRAVLRISGGHGVRYARLRPVTSTSGQNAHDRHLALWTAVRPTADLAIPRPLTFDAELGLSLLDALPGTPAGFSGARGLRAMQAVTRAIAALQDLAVDAAPHSPADELATLDDWASRVAPVFPDLAATLAPCLARLRDELLAPTASPAVPVHRDLHEGQILIADGRAGLLDFDTLRRGDPALDLGNLQAHLVLAGLRDGQPHDPAVMAQAERLPQLSQPRVALWRRAALLRLAMIYAFSATPPAVIRGLIAEAE